MTGAVSCPRPRESWNQVSLWAQDWQAAEDTAVRRIGPYLVKSEQDGRLAGWWFTRKGPCWRLRYLTCPPQADQGRAAIHDLMRALVAGEAITRWASGVYEPETRAFGGPDCMTTAHDLFCADSGHVLDHIRRAGTAHRCEAAVLLACTLMRAARLDWYEQGDVWQMVAAHRLARRPSSPTEAAAIRRLLTHRAITSALDPGWPAVFSQAGHALYEAAQDGRLTRGLRAVLAHHVLFAWNRAGIAASHQAILAQTAATAAFGHDPTQPAFSARPEPARLA
jgi:protein-L-isoaspartate(D-aspartate) O-methyltransferase